MAEHLDTTPTPKVNLKWFQKLSNQIEYIAKGQKEQNDVVEDLKTSNNFLDAKLDKTLEANNKLQ